MRNALTFDVEDYFHVEAAQPLALREWATLPSRVEANTHRLLALLDEHGVRATFFVLGWVAARYPRLVREIHDRGHEVGCHSYAHRIIYSMGRHEFREDVRRSKSTIEDALGAPIGGYRAPTFSVVRSSMWALGVLAEEGFLYDSSIFPIHHDRYGIPDAPRFPHRIRLANGADIAEFPLTTLPIAGQRLPFSGGGYFRLLPYRVIRSALRSINDREQQPGIVYLHPWELDPEQPEIPMRRLNRFRQHVNLARTGRKLRRLLQDFTFAPALEVLRERLMPPAENVLHECVTVAASR